MKKLCIPANFHIKISTIATFPLWAKKIKMKTTHLLLCFDVRDSNWIRQLFYFSFTVLFFSLCLSLALSSTLKSAILRLHLFSISIPFEQHYANLHSYFRSVFEHSQVVICLLAVVRLLSLGLCSFLPFPAPVVCVCLSTTLYAIPSVANRCEMEMSPSTTSMKAIVRL
jgi:hypothetical protein